ncbi:hypothetical protein M5C97_02485 [Acidovorax sp. NCPPB 3859]|nr:MULTISPECIES: hypothetical protein [unclassified Acidovorax]MDA8451275.1 hypothetical protein [Acidovorax sp. GBBC 3297]MDA8460720.1 hypothetical protein [Acidovorax sp. GBBC 3333]MDA8465755.1 hypothetical protein [Acidovorax sp. GBBC 3332]MDA8470757.1 hypothetical protein [Acidovorax sp. GBBC 3299]WCM79188.1 hypothetical protein M5C94_02485 [Acidovorax sp. GBBC 712]
MPSSATAAAPLPTAAEPDPKAAAGARAPTLSLAAWRQFMAVAKPYWLGDRKVAAWSLLGLLILLMLLETHLAVRLIDRTGE